MNKFVREITPLNQEDLFILLDNHNAKFDYQMHFHSDYELNLVLNASGKRLVGDSLENFGDEELILLGPNIPHAWKAPTDEKTHVITLQFQDKILHSFLLEKRLFSSVKLMLERSFRGIDFSSDTKKRVIPRLLNLTQSQGFNTYLEFFSILYELSITPDHRLLASSSYDVSNVIRESKSRRIAKVCDYINENFNRPILTSEVAELIGMTESAFSHFFKKRTNRSFIIYLNEIRIGHATKLLLETTHSIAEISFLCGFSNISNFNRTFKKIKGATPSEYRISTNYILTKY